MSKVIELLSFLPKGGTTKRDLDERSSEMALSVKDFGATGNGTTDDTAAIQACLDAAFGTAASPHGQSSELNKAVSFRPDTIKVSGNPALKVTGVKGGLIFGAGMYASRINSTTAASVLFTLNGFGFSSIKDIGFENFGSGACITLDFNWDHISPQGSQNSSFENCLFGQNNTNASSVVVALGRDGHQVDTSSFINCWVNGANAGSGYRSYNANVLSITVVGGQIAGCATGIFIPTGTISGIFNTYFTNRINTTDWDIDIQGGEGSFAIQGCRSESFNFLRTTAPTVTVNITGCSLNGEVLGHFVTAGGSVAILNCWSKLGDVMIGGGGANLGQVTISDSNFNRWDAFNINGVNAVAEARNCTFGYFVTGVCRTVVRQRSIYGSPIRTYDIEAANVSSDLNFLYENYLNPVAHSGVINTVSTNSGGSPTFTVASPTVVTNPGEPHWFKGGEAVAFTLVSGGTMPTGITSGRTYFVVADPLTDTPGTETTFHLSDTQAHALAGTNLINVSAAPGSSVNIWSVRRWAIGDIVQNTGVAAAGSPGWVCTTAGWASTVNAGETQAVFRPLKVLD